MASLILLLYHQVLGILDHKFFQDSSCTLLKMEEIWMLINIEENKQYMEEHQLTVFFEDVIVQILALHQEFNKMKTLKFFRDYFYSVLQGGHVILRDFNFISASTYNKLSVVRMLMQVYQPLVFNAGKFSARGYHSLLQLLWPDFPFDIVQGAFLIFPDVNEIPLAVSFFDFLTAFHKYFCSSSKFSVEVSMMNQQLLNHIERYRNNCAENQPAMEWNENNSASMLDNIKESVQEKLKSLAIASSWSLSHNLSQNSLPKSPVPIKESCSFSHGDSSTLNKKLLRSSSGARESHSLDLSSPEVKQCQANIKSRLSPRRLSGSLTVLQPSDREKHEESYQAVMQKVRSKSALNIQKNSTLLQK